MAYKELAITFDDFDLSDFDPEAGKINFGVVFSVEHGGQSYEVVPTFRGGMGGEPQVTSAAVPGTGGITLTPGRIDAEGGTVQLQVFDPLLAPEAPTSASLVLDVSTKPLISLVWIGTITDRDRHLHGHLPAPQRYRHDSCRGLMPSTGISFEF